MLCPWLHICMFPQALTRVCTVGTATLSAMGLELDACHLQVTKALSLSLSFWDSCVFSAGL